ncbi:transcriptional regulator, AraC family with amidase-like domain [Chryseolinea serpens]|uniref:Transcriptional regulator, AraC family with amidase-like domain n=1 Tax=Chryseolinea serpens TaxID=947013 RepID=A0A1M5TTG3_9BACT|nr:helix-turn-helix domain-containing protein [Chryseolinea serpens]SHH54067.1 transcriptional regulator, AraC family with amidase-like domain [Chryseolinea serpens]
MINITILALRNAVLASIADSCYVFSKVNEFLTRSGKPPLFNVSLAGLSKEINLNDGMFAIHPSVVLDEIVQPHLIIIPAMTGDMMTATHLNRDFAVWIARQYREGAEVASLCVGAFLMAFSGVLKGKQCTTHWAYANEFRHFYPSVKLIDEKVITDQNGLYSSGGNNAYWNLLLHLVEKYTDRKMAIHTAKYFVVDLNRDMQSPFIVFQGLKDHEDELISKAQDFIEENYRKKLVVEELADKFNVTRRTFERRFKKATRHTVIEYIQRVKVEATKKQLETTRKSVNDIMYSVGYVDIQTYRDLFKKITGMTPLDYRNKFNKDAGN